MDAVLIAGDGIGPEIAESVGKVSEALNTGIHWRKFAAGAGYYEKSGALFEEGMTDAIKETGIALKGPTATPIGTGFRSINVQLRQMFHTYANLRPVHSIPGVKSRYENVDLVIVRENTEDLYKGLEYMVDDNTAHGIKLITRPASERIVRFAFDYARRNGRHKVTAVHKANIMKETDGLFLEAARNVAKDYPDIAFDSVIIDALCMKLVSWSRIRRSLMCWWHRICMAILSVICVQVLSGALALRQVPISATRPLSMKLCMDRHRILPARASPIRQRC